ncbi:hypothetical protein [Massilia sp. 9096]|uniref:hypothetical protein n=1 Tax=Massilia sp. 9096 TaxID=1500894 RepID=UPI000565CFC9|nr:hypothetical protein [Massilia sp. 9096]
MPLNADQDWDWPAYAFAIPADCRSSVYVADLEEEGRKRGFDVARGWGAACARDRRVARITQNVLDHLLRA